MAVSNTNRGVHILFHILVVMVFVVSITNAQIHRSQEHKKWQRSKNSRNSNNNFNYDKENQVEYEKSIDNTHVWAYSIMSAFAVGMCGVFPLLVIPLEAGPNLRYGKGSAQLKLLLSFAVGSLLGDVFLHLLPETWQHTHSAEDHVRVGLWVLGGIFFFLIIEKVFGEQNDEKVDEKKIVERDKQTNYKNLSSNGFCKEKPNLKNKQNSKSKQNGTNKSNTAQNEQGDIKSTISNGHSYKRNISDFPNNDSTNAVMTQRKKPNVTKSNGHVKAIHNKNQEQASQQVQEHVTSNHTSAKHSDGDSRKTSQTRKRDNSRNSDLMPAISVSGYLNLFANVIDNFTHGLAIGGSYVISHKLGLLTTCAILIHEIPHEIGDFAILLKSGFNRSKAAQAQIVTACGSIMGVLCALCAESGEAAGNTTAWILPFTSGGFLYIALVTVTPDLLQESSRMESLKQVLCICCGVSAMLLVTVVIG